MKASALHSLKQIHQQKPLILNLTNTVSVELVANGLLSLGASPVMSQDIEDATALMKLSQALVINIGTLTESFLALAKEVCAIANEYHLPILLDPVGAGATSTRTKAAWELLEGFSIDIIRGNAGEISALSGASGAIKGVDTLVTSTSVIEQAKSLALQTKTIVVVSGGTDIITDGTELATSTTGSPIMPSITGTGCLLTAVIAAFRAVQHNRFAAALEASWYYGSCGELAERQAKGPGTFKMHFIDALNHGVLE